MSELSSLISPEPQTCYCLYHFHKRPCSHSEHSILGPVPSKKRSLSEKLMGPGAVTRPTLSQFCPRAHPFLGGTDRRWHEPQHAFWSSLSKPPTSPQLQLPPSVALHAPHNTVSVMSSHPPCFSDGFVIWDCSLFRSPKSFSFPTIPLVPWSVSLFLSLQISN